MPNMQDEDRIKSKFRNAAIVDLNAYKAAQQANTSRIYIDPATVSWIGTLFLVLAAFFLLVRR